MPFDLENIKEKSLHSVKWVSFSQILPKVFAPITALLLVNVFVPKDFGIVGICGAFISFVNLLQGLGIDDYLMRTKELTDEKLNTAYWTNLGVSIIFYLLLVIVSPLIALIYKENDLIYFIPVLGLNLIINASGFVPWALLRKRMEFKKLFFINFAPLVISLSITLPLGYAKLGPWAIVAGQVTLTLLTNIYFLVQSRWKPKIIYNKNEVKNILSFGKFVIYERVLEFLFANIDIFLIGYFLDLKTLGIYTFAKSLSWLIFGMITSPMTQILYPAFQKFIDDKERMVHHFMEVERRTFFITVPIFILIGGFATKAIAVMFPVRWEEAGLVLAFLIVGDGISKNFSLQRDLFKLIGRPEIYPKAFLVNFFYALIFYPIAVKYGLIYFLIVRVGNDFLYTFIQYYLTKKIFGFSGSNFYKIINSTLLSGVMLMFSIVAITVLYNLYIIKLNLLTVFISLLLCSAVYLITYFIIDKSSIQKYYCEGKIIFNIK